MTPWKPKVRVRMRRSGWAFLVVGVLVQLAAWNTGTNLLYVVAGGLASFLAVGFFLSRRALKGLEVSSETPASVHRGDPFAINLRLENHRRYLPVVSVRVESSGLAQAESAYVAKIPAQKTALVRISGVFPRRGIHPVPTISLHCAFPLGLFERTLTASDLGEVVVYPRVTAVRTSVLDQMHGTGETPKLKRGDGDEFFSLRDYQPGDDLRKIAWRVTARVGHLIVRELEPSTSHHIFIGFDSRDLPGVDEFVDLFEEAVDLVASMAVSFLNRSYSVAVSTPDESCPLGEGNSHAFEVLRLLARIIPAPHGAHGDDWFTKDLGVRGAGYICVSPDPSQWGRRTGPRGTAVVDPREVVRA